MNECELMIERVGLEGQGVGYDSQSNIYFVPGALPGDRVRVQFEDTSKRYRDAQLLKIIHPSPERKAPLCAHFAECGGCDWLDWDYEAQVKAKAAMLKHVIDRTPFVPKHWLPFLASRRIYGYRNRIQLKRVGNELGFYRKASHDLVPIEACAIADARLNEAITALRGNVTKPYGKVELMLSDKGGVEHTFDAPHGASGFCQVNPSQNEQLRLLVRTNIERSCSSHVAELYCGDGNLTFGYADLAKSVVAADASEVAIKKASQEVQGTDLAHVEFIRSPVGYSLSRKIEQKTPEAYDTLVLDPPRSGVGKVLEFFIHPLVKNIIYISCSPVSFSKDILALKKYCFELHEIQGIDMFPHTRHIELVARFSRS